MTNWGKAFDGRLAYVRDVLSNINLSHFPNPFTFRAMREGDVIKFCFSVYLPDNTNPADVTEQGCEWQNGRGWVVENSDSEKAIVRTALLAVITFQEHELREQFTYKGEALYEPDHT